MTRRDTLFTSPWKKPVTHARRRSTRALARFLQGDPPMVVRERVGAVPSREGDKGHEAAHSRRGNPALRAVAWQGPPARGPGGGHHRPRDCRSSWPREPMRPRSARASTSTASDLRFILKQIKIAERARGHAERPRTRAARCSAPGRTRSRNGNQQGVELPWGLRTVDGTCNNLIARPGASSARPTPSSRAWSAPAAAPQRPTAGTSVHPEGGDGRRLRPAHGQQPDRGPDRRATRPRSPPPVRRPEAPDGGHAVHPQRGPRRRPVRAVQLAVHALRPVLRPRPRPGHQGRRHGVHAAAGPDDPLLRRRGSAAPTS